MYVLEIKISGEGNFSFSTAVLLKPDNSLWLDLFLEARIYPKDEVYLSSVFNIIHLI